MHPRSIHRLSHLAVVALPFIALLTVLIGYTQPVQSDEGALAHIFQLSIAGVVLMLLVFLATADWTKPTRCVRALALPVVTLAIAFAALYYLEHFR